MKHYFKLDGDIIVDAIQYPFDGYVEAELPEITLPAGINGGWYRWDGEGYALDEELKRAADERAREGIIEQHAQIFEAERERAREELLAELLASGVITNATGLLLDKGEK